MEYLRSPEDRLPRQNQRTEASAPLKLPFRTHARVGPLMLLVSFPSPRVAATSNFAWGEKKLTSRWGWDIHTDKQLKAVAVMVFSFLRGSCWCSMSSSFTVHRLELSAKEPV